MDDIVRRFEGDKYFNSLSKEEQDLITKVFLATIDVCSEIVTESLDKPVPIFFYEDVAYKVLKYEMLGHMLADELYNANVRAWQKGDEFNPKY